MRDKPPVFIHSWWRSSSTYVWSKLRQDRSLQCFYEPLHEKIATLNQRSIQSDTELAMGQMLRHPALDKNYFHEYLQLIRSNNLHYTPDLAYERYLLHPEQSDIKLYKYLDGLISAASRDRRKAVLCFCRSQMRSGWMKKSFVGTHIAQIRNPFDQWSSFQVNTYFINKMVCIALSLRNMHPDAFTHVQHFEHQAQRLHSKLANVEALANQMRLSKRDCFRIFMVIWIASALHSVASADFVLDVDALTSDADYQRSTSLYFFSLGCAANFSDCLVPNALVTSGIPAEMEELAKEAINAIRFNAQSLAVCEADMIAKHLPMMAPASRRILSLATGSA